jgi:hypothetical protein
MSPVGVFENEMESFTPGRVMTESSKSSRTSAVSALVMFGEAMTREKGLRIDSIYIERALETNVMGKESSGE